MSSDDDKPEKILELTTRLNQAERDIKHIRSAFPDEDIEGHNRYHSTVVEMLAEKRRLRRAIQEKTISGLIWAGIVGLSTLVWQALKIKFGQ